MSDKKSLVLLLELVQNPLVEGNYRTYKFERERLKEADPELTEQMLLLGETTEKALEHLAENGIVVAGNGNILPRSLVSYAVH